jgi:hypothetical protein
MGIIYNGNAHANSFRNGYNFSPIERWSSPTWGPTASHASATRLAGLKERRDGPRLWARVSLGTS